MKKPFSVVWELSGKHFSVQDVPKILAAIDPSQGVSAESAQARGDYRGPLIAGCAITLFPSPDRATIKVERDDCRGAMVFGSWKVVR